MRALSLCQSCKRHIRVSESACPFCGAAFSLPPETRVSRPRGRPGGRAALFLAGAASAPGCADEPDLPEQAIPIYGAPIDNDASSRASDGGPTSDAREFMPIPPYGIAIPVYGIPIDRDAGVDANVCGEPPPPMPVPVYGVALDAGARDAGRDAACGSDGGSIDAGSVDSGRIALPPYGIGIDFDRNDASTRDSEVMVTPVYGLWSEREPEE